MTNLVQQNLFISQSQGRPTFSEFSIFSRHRLDDLDPIQGQDVFLFHKRSKRFCRPSGFLFNWHLGYFPVAKEPKGKAEYSPQTRVEVKSKWSHTSTFSHNFMAWKG